MYVAKVGENLTVKLGPRYDMPPELVPSKEKGWSLACSGKDYAVWTNNGS
jgi:alpha-amylase